MNRVWYKIALLAFILTFIFAPFAGFAPVLLVLLIASVYWLLNSLVSIIVFGEPNKTDVDS